MWPKSTTEARKWINQITAERDWVRYQLINLNRCRDGWQKVENCLSMDWDRLNARINNLEDSIIQTYYSI